MKTEEISLKTIVELQEENELLKNQMRILIQSVASSEKEKSTLKDQVLLLTEQIEWFKRQIFGSKSERVVPASDQQLNFFNLVDGDKKSEGTPPPEKPFPSQEPRKRKKPNRDGRDAIKLPDGIPVEIIFLDIPESEKICPETGVPMVKIGEEVSERIVHRRGSVCVRRTIRPKYATPKKEESGIAIAELPDSILPKCSADESLLAEIICQKFADHLPLYRISEILSRIGVGISRKLLSQWILKCGLALIPLYDAMSSVILQSGNVFVDETPISVLDKNMKKGFMWVLVGGKAENPPYRVYQFYMNRCHENVQDLLGEYAGVVHSDKYEAYVKLSKQKDITWCPCWAHIRRYFFEADSGDPLFRKWVLRKIRYLFMFERVAWARSPEERVKIRLEKEVPIIDELITAIKAQLLKRTILPKSKLGKALGYFFGLIPYLKNYTSHPFARLENNPAERAIRPLAVGRKNWLFFGSEQGGKSAAVILSLVQTCRGLDINPREYLEDVMRRIMSHPANKLYELLPDLWLLSKKKEEQGSPPKAV